VLKALQDGKLSEGRYQSYLKLVKESDHYQMSLFEKRKKDRAFGRMIKTAKKHSKKK
jgi:ribosome biogenesis GTPase